MKEIFERAHDHSMDKKAVLAREAALPRQYSVCGQFRSRFLPILIALLLASCAPAADHSKTAVSSDQPQITQKTPAAIDPMEGEPTPPPLTEATPAIIIEPSFPAPTPTNIPSSVSVPLEELSILSPGPSSMVNSPIQVKGYGGPSLNNRVQVRLIGEDGRLLSEGYTFLYSYPGRPGLFYIKMPFESQFVAERAWLEVRSFDDPFGMLRHLESVEVTILSTGSDHVYPAIHGAEKLTIFQPREENVIAGGSVLIQGAGWVDRNVPLRIEIVNLAGEVLGAGQVDLDAPAVSQLGTFSVEIDYQTSHQQWARIGVYEMHDEVPCLVHYASVGVWLEP